jgi:hypothetical protein
MSYMPRISFVKFIGQYSDEKAEIELVKLNI